MEHELKTWLDPFQAIHKGVKTFEFRLNDRGYAVGDTLVLREWDERRQAYTGREIVGTVGYILAEGFGLPAGFYIMQLYNIQRSIKQR